MIHQQTIPTLEEIGNIPLRKSMMEDYFFCPHKFNKVWIESGTMGKNNPDVKSNYAMKAGTRFHEFAQRFFNHCCGIPVDEWKSLIPKEFKSLREKRMANWFVELEQKRYKEHEEEGRLGEWRPIAREIKMEHKGLLIESTADRIDYVDKEKDEIAIVEYKTGESEFLPSLLRQLAYYALLWSETMNYGHVRKLIVVNPHKETVKTYQFYTNQIDKVMNNIITVRQAMRNGGPYPRKCSIGKFARCGMCSIHDVNIRGY